MAEPILRPATISPEQRAELVRQIIAAQPDAPRDQVEMAVDLGIHAAGEALRKIEDVARTAGNFATTVCAMSVGLSLAAAETRAQRDVLAQVVGRVAGGTVLRAQINVGGQP